MAVTKKTGNIISAMTLTQEQLKNCSQMGRQFVFH